MGNEVSGQIARQSIVTYNAERRTGTSTTAPAASSAAGSRAAVNLNAPVVSDRGPYAHPLPPTNPNGPSAHDSSMARRSAAWRVGGNNDEVFLEDNAEVDEESLSSLESESSSGSSSGGPTVAGLTGDADFFAYGSGRLSQGGGGASSRVGAKVTPPDVEAMQRAQALRRRVAGRRLTEEEKGKYSTLGPPVRITKKDGTTTIEDGSTWKEAEGKGHALSRSGSFAKAKKRTPAQVKRAPSPAKGNGTLGQHDDDGEDEEGGRSPRTSRDQGGLLRADSAMGGSAYGSFVGRDVLGDDDMDERAEDSNARGLYGSADTDDTNGSDVGGMSAFNLGDLRGSSRQSRHSMLNMARQSSRNLRRGAAGNTSLYNPDKVNTVTGGGTGSSSHANNNGNTQRPNANSSSGGGGAGTSAAASGGKGLAKASSFFAPALSASPQAMQDALYGNHRGYSLPASANNRLSGKEANSNGHASGAKASAPYQATGAPPQGRTSRAGFNASMYGIGFTDSLERSNANFEDALEPHVPLDNNTAPPAMSTGNGAAAAWHNGYQSNSAGQDTSNTQHLSRHHSSRRRRVKPDAATNAAASGRTNSSDSDTSGGRTQSFSSSSLREGRMFRRGGPSGTSGNKIRHGTVNKLAAANGGLHKKTSASYLAGDSTRTTREVGNGLHSEENGASGDNPTDLFRAGLGMAPTSPRRGRDKAPRTLFSLGKTTASDYSLSDFGGGGSGRRNGSQATSEASFHSASSRFSSQSSHNDSNNSASRRRLSSSGLKQKRIEPKSVNALKKKAQRVRDSSASSTELSSRSTLSSDVDNFMNQVSMGHRGGAGGNAEFDLGLPELDYGDPSSVLAPAPPSAQKAQSTYDRRRGDTSGGGVHSAQMRDRTDTATTTRPQPASSSTNYNYMYDFASAGNLYGENNSSLPDGMSRMDTGMGPVSQPSSGSPARLSGHVGYQESSTNVRVVGAGFTSSSSSPRTVSPQSRQRPETDRNDAPKKQSTSSGNFLPELSPTASGRLASAASRRGAAPASAGSGLPSVTAAPSSPVPSGGGGGGGGGSHFLYKTSNVPSSHGNHATASGSRLASVPSTNATAGRGPTGAPAGGSFSKSRAHATVNAHGHTLPTIANVRQLSVNVIDSGLDSEGEEGSERTSFSSASAHLFVHNTNNYAPAKQQPGVVGYQPHGREEEGPGGTSSSTRRTDDSESLKTGGANAAGLHAVGNGGSGSVRSGPGGTDTAGDGNGDGSGGAAHRRRRPQTETFHVWQVNADRIKNLMAQQHQPPPQESLNAGADSAANLPS